MLYDKRFGYVMFKSETMFYIKEMTYDSLDNHGLCVVRRDTVLGWWVSLETPILNWWCLQGSGATSSVVQTFLIKHVLNKDLRRRCLTIF